MSALGQELTRPPINKGSANDLGGDAHPGVNGPSNSSWLVVGRPQTLVLILIKARGATPMAIFDCHESQAFHRR